MAGFSRQRQGKLPRFIPLTLLPCPLLTSSGHRRLACCLGLPRSEEQEPPTFLMGSSPLSTKTFRGAIAVSLLVLFAMTSPPPAAVSALSSASEAKAATRRTFQFVEYGRPYIPPPLEKDRGVDHRPTISCDGRVPGGVTLELTHWTDNATPDEYYADTSTEMALKLPDDVLPDAVVLNNHYDTDGVLSVFACLYPDVARRYADLLREGAEAGDFGEWSSDSGIKLDAVLCGVLGRAKSEADAYITGLSEVPSILRDLEDNGGDSYRDDWKVTLQSANRGWEALKEGKASICVASLPSSTETVAVVSEPPDFSLSPYSLHRGLREQKLLDKVTRVLRVTQSDEGGSSYQYVYEKPGHGWVQRLVSRPSIPNVADASRLVKLLNDRCCEEESIAWATGGPSGLVSICYTNRPIQAGPDEIVALLAELEQTCQGAQLVSE